MEHEDLPPLRDREHTRVRVCGSLSTTTCVCGLEPLHHLPFFRWTSADTALCFVLVHSYCYFCFSLFVEMERSFCLGVNQPLIRPLRDEIISVL